MPFCPNCKYEYKATVSVCPDCNEPLVDVLPEDVEDEFEEDYDNWVPLCRLRRSNPKIFRRSFIPGPAISVLPVRWEPHHSGLSMVPFTPLWSRKKKPRTPPMNPVLFLVIVGIKSA
jgi:hypothetical protein